MQAQFSSNLEPHLVAIESISADPANLRKHPERSIDAIKASLRRFGQQKPLVVDANGVVVAGNGTLEAARQLGWKQIAAVKSDLVGVDRTLFAIADNRSAELSEWDREALAATLNEIPPEFRTMIGFTPDELSELCIGMGPEVEEDDIPEVLPHAVSKIDDLWILGTHRLLCGDSTSAADVTRLMNGEKAELVSTDPPYVIDYTGVRGDGRGKDWSAVYKETEIKDPAAFYRAVFSTILNFTAPRVALYCWHAREHAGLIESIWKELGILVHQQIIWVKPTPVFGRVVWHFRHENCLMGWVKGHKPKEDGDRTDDSAWEIVPPRAEDLAKMTKVQLVSMILAGSSVWHVDWEGKARIVGNEHPTQKPVEIFARPMKKHTPPGAIVFEPFSGSGSQLIAAEQLGRRCMAIDLQPVFVDVAIRRWQKLTGQPARLDGDGRTWEEIAAARKEQACQPSQVDSAASSVAKRSRAKAATAKNTRPHTAAPAKRGTQRKALPTAADTEQPGGSSGKGSSVRTRSAKSASVSPQPK